VVPNTLIEGVIDVPWLRAEPPAWGAYLLSGEADPADAPDAPLARNFLVVRWIVAIAMSESKLGEPDLPTLKQCRECDEWKERGDFS
jgi:hypothetical protein